MKLKKELSLLDVFCITTGAMMSSGIFILPGLAFARAGPAVLVSYLLAALLAGAGVLSQAELASSMPKAGGAYFYVTRSMGAAVGTVYGLITFLALAFKSAFELMGMAIFARLLFSVDMHLIAALLCAFFILVNIVGVKEAGRVQVVLVLVIISALVLYAVRGLPASSIPHFDPFAPGGVAAIVSTAGFVFVSYGGLLKIASLAEEVKDPGRVLPRGMILSLLVVVAVYTLVIFVTIGVSGPSELAESLRPVSDGAEAIMGPRGKALLSVVAVLGFISATNAGVMGASRYPLALSRDQMLPGFLSRLNQRFQTPHYSLLVTGLFITGALFLDLELIVKAASSVLILTYAFSCLANVIMRESRLMNYQPSFRAPLYPWVQIIGVIGYGFLLFEIGLETVAICSSAIAAGLFLYWFYGRIRASREYALLHVVERVTARELTTHSLEQELKEIIHERDDIQKDKFDRLIERCIVLDLDEALSAEEFLELAAKELADKLGADKGVLLELLLERERDSCTVISPGLAIPHIIVPGERTFELLLARSRQGIEFSCVEEPVHALFVLVGSRDERNFHLRALAAIAQIAMAPDFEKRWMAARSEEALRDVVIMGKRRR